jgi:hypothetical protein
VGRLRHPLFVSPLAKTRLTRRGFVKSTVLGGMALTAQSSGAQTVAETWSSKSVNFAMPTAALADFCANFAGSEIPVALRRLAHTFIVDNLATMLVGAVQPVVPVVNSIVLAVERESRDAGADARFVSIVPWDCQRPVAVASRA